MSSLQLLSIRSFMHIEEVSHTVPCSMSIVLPNGKQVSSREQVDVPLGVASACRELESLIIEVTSEHPGVHLTLVRRRL